MIPTGKFSRICQVSVKTLRLYDQIGILKPAYIDANSSYRYYEPDQLDTMIFIQRYKRFGFSLEEIKSMLEDVNSNHIEKLIERKTALIQQKTDLEVTISELRILIECIERKENMIENILGNYEINIVEKQPISIYGLRQEMSVADFGAAYSRLFEDLYQKGIKDFGLTGSRYYDQEFDRNKSDVEVFVEVASEAANAKIQEGVMVHTTHKGAYATLQEAYAAIVKWMEQNGYEGVGAPFELYTKCGFNHYPVDEWETDIYFPAQKKI